MMTIPGSALCLAFALMSSPANAQGSGTEPSGSVTAPPDAPHPTGPDTLERTLPSSRRQAEPAPHPSVPPQDSKMHERKNCPDARKDRSGHCPA
ncbi:hypothetical protein HLH34_06390 [Gluconacetobacter azotocaptans]|uniref:Uncharacterized protein n=1 Tax=Gluconacetobacter azotocaptans TaxID=142834 RepID=A0A7W4JRQ4_9PROT|nr:hypothetical protein [Gluconacetobacter azotocaptans]MBB2189592.1 hypothetical protein [Gluconacetobacter azotocaptans]MBM9403682.1 hypothetical protein [Gluconacetobacter azotocaptans]